MTGSRLRYHLARHGRANQAAADVLCIAAALVSSVLFLQDNQVSDGQWRSLAILFGIVIVVQLLVGRGLGLYTGRWQYGGFEEIRAVVATVVVTSGVLVVASLVLAQAMYERSQVGAAMLALLLMLAVRYVVRSVREHRLRPSRLTAKPALVLGAGNGGAQIIHAMLRSPDSPYVPVGLLDDDPRKSQLRISGVPVLGTRAALASVIQQTGSRTLVVAIPSAGASLIRDIVDRASPLGVEIRVLPPVAELLGAPVQVSDIRSVTYADLLGRREVEIDLASVAGYLTGRRVLVTGAGGSIGSELCRQITRFHPGDLIMLDRDESALHALQMSLEGRALLSDESLVVADIRDRARLNEVFEKYQPQVVFHAAALKHLPLLQMHPSEGIKTNIIGTQNLLNVSVRHHVTHFVNISTDKAADPSSVLGYTKRITERLTASAAETAPGAFLSVRFGNVLGSRGSVLPAFREQIAAGGPVTVTHPDVTRYFMTVEEAVRLVVQSGAIGGHGDVQVLDMGEPVRIADIAQRLIDTSGRAVDIVFTGLRPGEKMHEDLLGKGEADQRPKHPLISQVPVPPLDGSALALLDTGAPRLQLIAMLSWLALAPPLSWAVSSVLPHQRDAGERQGRRNARGRTRQPELQVNGR